MNRKKRRVADANDSDVKIQFHTLESVRDSQMRKSQEDSAGREGARRNQTTNGKQNKNPSNRNEIRF